MSHMLSDMLDKFISIEQGGNLLFLNLASKTDVPLRVKTIARVFAKEEERHISLYRQLKDRIKESADIEVDYELYGKAEKLINNLNELNSADRIMDIRQLLEFSLTFERENLVLVLELQNLSGNQNPELYNILEELATEERKHIGNIEGYIK